MWRQSFRAGVFCSASQFLPRPSDLIYGSVPSAPPGRLLLLTGQLRAATALRRPLRRGKNPARHTQVSPTREQQNASRA